MQPAGLRSSALQNASQDRATRQWSGAGRAGDGQAEQGGEPGADFQVGPLPGGAEHGAREQVEDPTCPIMIMEGWLSSPTPSLINRNQL